MWRRPCGVKCNGSLAFFNTFSIARRTLAGSAGVLSFVTNNHEGSSAHPYLSYSSLRVISWIMSVSAWVRLLTGCRCAGNGRVGKNCRTDGGLLSEVQDARKAGMSAIGKSKGYTGGEALRVPQVFLRSLHRRSHPPTIRWPDIWAGLLSEHGYCAPAFGAGDQRSDGRGLEGEWKSGG